MAIYKLLKNKFQPPTYSPTLEGFGVLQDKELYCEIKEIKWDTEEIRTACGKYTLNDFRSIQWTHIIEPHLLCMDCKISMEKN